MILGLVGCSHAGVRCAQLFFATTIHMQQCSGVQAASAKGQMHTCRFPNKNRSWQLSATWVDLCTIRKSPKAAPTAHDANYPQRTAISRRDLHTNTHPYTTAAASATGGLRKDGAN